MKKLANLVKSIILTAIVLAIDSCANQEMQYIEKKVTVVRVWEYRIPNSLQDYEPHWRAKLSDSSIITFNKKPLVGDTITYKYVLSN